MTCPRVSRAAWKVSPSFTSPTKGVPLHCVTRVSHKSAFHRVLQDREGLKKNAGVSCKSVRKDWGRHAVFQRDGKQWRWLYVPRYLNLHAKVLFQNLPELCSWICSMRYAQGMEMFFRKFATLCNSQHNICASSDTVGAPIKNMSMKFGKTNIRIWGCSGAVTITRESVWHFWCHDLWLPTGCVCFAGRSITCITCYHRSSVNIAFGVSRSELTKPGDQSMAGFDFINKYHQKWW